jgi:hypothetical protein
MALYHRVGLHARIVPLEKFYLIPCNIARDSKSDKLGEVDNYGWRQKGSGFLLLAAAIEWPCSKLGD